MVTDPRTPFKTKLMTFKKLINLRMKKVKRLRIVIKPNPPRFSGWGLTSIHFTPCDPKSSDEIGLEFAEVNKRLLAGLNAKEIVYGGGTKHMVMKIYLKSAFGAIT